MKVNRCLLAAALLTLAACSPPEYPPPPQKALPPGPDPRLTHLLVNMSDYDVDARIVQDVLHADPGSQSRWTNQHPRFKLTLDSTQGWKFYMRFGISKDVLQETGPMTLSVVIDGHVLAAPKFDKDTEYEWSHPVRPEMLTADKPILIGLDIDPIYVAKADGMKLGVLIESIGFKRADDE